MTRSFTVRLAVAFVGMGLAGALLTAVLVNVAFDRRFSSYVEDRREQGERELLAALRDSFVRNGGWEAEDLAGLEASALMSGLSFSVEDNVGATVWSSSDGRSSEMAAMHREMMGTGPLGPARRLPVEINGDNVGLAEVRGTAGGLRPDDVAFRASVNRLLLGGGLIVGVLALGVGVVLARRATAPVQELTNAAQARTDGDRGRRVTLDRLDEFGAMGQAFNQMADTVEEEDRLRRVFAREVAHELRTPLTILQSHIEAFQDGVSEPTPVALASLHDEVHRLSRIVADLEALASADAAGFTLERRPVALRELLQEAAREWDGPLHEAGLGLELDLDDGIVADVDATRIGQVVANLLSNAAKFTPAGGFIGVELECVDGWAVIRVSDTGCGIPPEEVAMVFGRFYRGRTSRARGSGIGLAIVKQLVDAHGGAVEARSQPGQGTVFTVRLPQATRLLRRSFTASS